MKSSVTSGLCAAALLCLFLAAPTHAAANPFQSIGSGLKKAGNALNPFKKAAPKPAAESPPPATTPKPPAAKSAKPAPVKKKKPVATPTATSKKTSSGTSPKKETKPAGTSDPADKPAEGPPEADSTAVGDTPAVTDSATAPAPAEIPFGTPVMGRKGYVRSPYAEDQGMVDVTDIPAGAKVKCPFTGKVFRVP